MIPFLKELAQKIHNNHREHMGEVLLIFPNRRAGLFFRKYLAEYLDAPVWSPNVMSMEDFVGQYASLQVADKFTLIIDMYHAYRKHIAKDEGFEKFYYWGEMLLKDFDDIDKYLINPKHLFTNVSRQKELDDTFDFLTPEQQEIILSFWSKFEVNPSKEKTDFKTLWDKLFDIYESYTNGLKANGRAYTGMLYKSLAEGVSVIENCDKLVFAGFNALTTAEEAIITYCVEEGAQVHWDVDAYYVDDKRQEAGEFFREYRDKNMLGKTFPKPCPDNINAHSADRKITLNAASLDVGQVKMLGSQLVKITESPDFEPEKTVIVLPSEHMLFPVLNAIPESVKALNVTMGFPLLSTPLYSLLTSLLEMQQSAVEKEGQLTFYFKPLLQVLQHPLINDHAPEEVRGYISQIEQRNQTKVALVAEKVTPFYQLLIAKCHTVHELLAYLNQVIIMLFDESDRELDSLEKEYAYQFYTQLNRIKEVFLTDQLQLSITAFIKLFTQIITSHRIPFSGEPLRGLQIMGVLETRNLDFEHVYVLSMNEGMFPAQGSQHSFVPYNLRKAYGLPTYDQQDSMFSYLFYRLIQKAKHVHLYYNTVEEKGGELSRLVQQLMMESGHEVTHKVWSPQATLSSIEPITIMKSPEVLRSLEKFLVSNQSPFKRLTPSAISIYLDCRLKFYYRYVAEIYEYDSIQTEIDPMVFGNILHHTMELLYKPYAGKFIAPEDKKPMLSSLKAVIDQAFLTHYLLEEGDTFEYEGKLIIARNIVNKYVKKIIDLDMEYAPFEVLGLEESDGYGLDLPMDSGQHVGLKGIIDRIDRKEGVVRVIDYKTGQDNKVLTSMESLFDRDDEKRNKAAMQTFFYALLYANKHPDATTVVPGIFNTKEMFSKEFDYHLKMQGEKANQKTPVYNAMPYLEEFKSRLTNLVEELYAPEVPFDQTNEVKKCEHCPYQEICGR
jgi:hypothetical protein